MSRKQTFLEKLLRFGDADDRDHAGGILCVDGNGLADGGERCAADEKTILCPGAGDIGVAMDIHFVGMACDHELTLGVFRFHGGGSVGRADDRADLGVGAI